MSILDILGENAKKASREISCISSEKKNSGLKQIAKLLIDNEKYILDNNFIDIENAKSKGIKGAFIDRLKLDHARIVDMAEGLIKISDLPDPIGEISSMIKRPNGLQIGKQRVPLGVIGIIYESRPNVTVDATGLCLKAGNAVILRGGSEAINSNKAILDIVSKALEDVGFPKFSAQIVEDTSRDTVIQLMKLNKYIDVLIPRGGENLIRTVVENSTIPVIETGVGNCHVFVDCDADTKMARDIIINAKTSRPGVCNAMETLLVDTKIAKSFLPLILAELREKGVEIRGCEKTKNIFPHAISAIDKDWATEYLDFILAVKVVDNMDDAIDHISKYGTKHSEAIVTSDYSKAREFLNRVDAAAVYVNASTRFTDGYEFGFGAEIGISTQKLHARGPMGLAELTTTKYIIFGDGQIRI